MDILANVLEVALAGLFVDRKRQLPSQFGVGSQFDVAAGP